MFEKFGRVIALCILFWFAAPCLEVRADPPQPTNSAQCRPDEETIRVRQELLERGFTDSDFFNACGSVARWAPGQSEKIKEVAVLSALGFSERQARGFARNDISLEYYMNHKYHNLRRAGVIMVVSGISLAVVGIFVRSQIDLDQYENDEEYDATAMNPEPFARLGAGLATIAIIVGGAATVSGSIMALVGHHRIKAHTPPEGLFEDGDADEIRKWYFSGRSWAADSSRTKPTASSDYQLAVSPVVGPKFGGLALQITF